MTDWEHDALQADLAQARAEAGEMVVQKLALGAWGGHAQADVVTMRPSWTQPTPTIYEVKISRADFLSDVRSRKFEKYLPYCRRLYFAVPKGLVDRKEVPEECGVCVRGPRGWHTTRGPRLRMVDDERFAALVFSFLLRLHPASWRMTREDRIARNLRALRGRDLREIWAEGLDLGAEVRRLLEDGKDAASKVAHLERRLAALDPHLGG